MSFICAMLVLIQRVCHFFSLRANDPHLTNDGNFNKLAAYSF